MVVTVTHAGYVKARSCPIYRSQKRGKGVQAFLSKVLSKAAVASPMITCCSLPTFGRCTATQGPTRKLPVDNRTIRGSASTLSGTLAERARKVQGSYCTTQRAIT